ncbi:MAG: 50S ribosomal protein L1 [Candidatus Omnitrophica bacterium]|nr:50S ribosomal protein L1 [Candidatus Omnitrophota bacterium]
MKKPSKRLKKCLEAIEKGKFYSLEEAVSILKGLPAPKFDQTVEIACNLNIDPKQSEQMVRGSTVLPHGIGKKVRVCVFCKGEDVNKAKEAGADFAGASDLIEKIKKGWLEFDKTASTPEMMKEVAQLGKILGPRGLMPSPKAGTVGPDIGRIVQDLNSGKIQFKADKTANIHVAAGKISFSVQDICENASSLVKAILAVRPSAVKGRLVKSLTITTTMGPAIKLDTARIK